MRPSGHRKAVNTSHWTRGHHACLPVCACVLLPSSAGVLSGQHLAVVEGRHVPLLLHGLGRPSDPVGETSSAGGPHLQRFVNWSVDVAHPPSHAALYFLWNTQAAWSCMARICLHPSAGWLLPLDCLPPPPFFSPLAPWHLLSLPIREQGYHYVSVQGAGSGANASVGFSNYGEAQDCVKATCRAPSFPPYPSLSLSLFPPYPSLSFCLFPALPFFRPHYLHN